MYGSRISHEYFSREHGKMVPLSREVRMAVLESGGVHYGVVGCQARTNDWRLAVDASGNLASNAGIGPYTRIAAVPPTRCRSFPWSRRRRGGEHESLLDNRRRSIHVENRKPIRE